LLADAEKQKQEMEQKKQHRSHSEGDAERLGEASPLQAACPWEFVQFACPRVKESTGRQRGQQKRLELMRGNAGEAIRMLNSARLKCFADGDFDGKKFEGK
jgi:hypothetical protein